MTELEIERKIATPLLNFPLYANSITSQFAALALSNIQSITFYEATRDQS